MASAASAAWLDTGNDAAPTSASNTMETLILNMSTPDFSATGRYNREVRTRLRNLLNCR